jgi:toxin ParE1/3/4
MATIHISARAKTDLLEIGAYTQRSWGETQMLRYLDGLERCIKILARNPGLGRACGWIRPGLHRFEQGRHVVFYRHIEGGILVVRFLHQSMLPDRQAFEDENV